ncbi:hypothetical protein [Mariniluteicoccus flavus]
MTTNRRLILRAAGLTGATGLALTSFAPAAHAEGPVSVTNTETVQAYLAPDGTVREARIYEQLALEGRGTAKISNPVATDGLRNLDEFGGFQVVNSRLETTQQVDGQARLRTVSNYDAKKIPLKVKVSYRLDGKPVTAKQLVGKSGALDVRYVVENVTGRDQTFQVDDGTGKMVERTERVVVPMVGQLTTTLPSTFSDVQSGEANMAGDGRGGTKLSFTMTLFGPIGSPKAEFGYTAQIKDGAVPPASVSGLPVNPLQSPSFKAGAASYGAGAKSGRDLSSGAAQIDENLIKLRDGGNQLLAGLVKLREGSAELNRGLSTEAAPGARQLADGGDQLKDGAGQLKDGTGKLKEGTGKLADGTLRLVDGTGRLVEGTVKLQNGTVQLKDGTVKLVDGTGRLKDGTGRLVDGTGRLVDGTGRLAAGTVELAAGTGKLAVGAEKLEGGAAQLDAGADKLYAGLSEATKSAPQLIAGLEKISAGLNDLDAGMVKMYDQIGGVPEKAKPLHEGIQKLQKGIGSTKSEGTLLHGVDQLRTQIGEGAAGLLTVADKVYKESDSKDTAGAYQKIDCAVQVAKQLNEGGYGTNPDGSKRTTFDPFCYGGQAAILNAAAPLGSTAGESNPIKKLILANLAAELAKGRDQLADPNKLGNPNSAAYIDGAKPDPSSATMQQALTYIGGRLKNRAVPGLVKVECGLSATSFGTDPKASPCADPKTGQFAPGILEGLGLVDQGVTTLVNEVVKGVQTGVGTQGQHDAALAAAKKGESVEASSLRAGTGALSGGMDLIQEGGARLLEGMTQLQAGAGQLKQGTGALSLGAVELSNGVVAADAGANRLKAGAGELSAGAGELKKGASELNSGAGELNTGAGKLDAGVGEVNKGAGQLNQGAGELNKGAGDVNRGAGELNQGAGKLDEGASKLYDGAGRLKDGATKLATGLDKAADGSSQIADGTREAADGGAKIPQGANELHEKGSSKLMDAGKNTSVDYGVKYAAIEAGAKRAEQEAMPIGAPAGAQGMTAYSLEIDGVDGSESRSLGQGLAGLGMFAAAAALLRKRFAA